MPSCPLNVECQAGKNGYMVPVFVIYLKIYQTLCTVFCRKYVNIKAGYTYTHIKYDLS